MNGDVMSNLDQAWKAAYLRFGDYLNRDQWDKIAFRRCLTPHADQMQGLIMVFTEPIYHDEKRRIIPNYPRYAVDEFGEVLDRVTSKIVKRHTYIHDGWYPSVDVFNERTQVKRTVGLHRLVALAWCDNDDWYNKIIVNHIDGNKDNFFASNLEWCTYSENALHAFKNGLRTDNVPCVIRSKNTGEVLEFYSMGDMGRKFGLSKARDTSYYLHGPAHRLLFGEWEVRINGDDRPWYYEIGQPAVPKSRYVTTVTYPDGTKETYWDNRDIIKKFKCWNVGSGIEPVLKKAREIHPDLTFEYEDRWKDRIVQVIDVKTMEIVDESPWLTNSSELMKCSKSAVLRLLNLNEHRPKNGYAVRYKPNEETPWNILDEDYVGKAVCIQVTDMETGKITIFNSSREIERDLKISRFVLNKRMRDNKPVGKYCFSEI